MNTFIMCLFVSLLKLWYLLIVFGISAIVVCAGVTYGGKEDVLYYWFQNAWQCEKFLPIIGRGANAVPLINVMDLAQ